MGMVKKTLGIIGKGKLITHLFTHLKESDNSPFSDNFDEILFWRNHREEADQKGKVSIVEGYSTNESFEKSGSYEKIKSAITTNFGEKIKLSKPEGDFSAFIRKANIVIDATGTYRPFSLRNLAEALGKNEDAEKINSLELQLDFNQDFETYYSERKNEGRELSEGLILMDFPHFKKYWDSSKNILDQVRKVKTPNAQGELVYLG